MTGRCEDCKFACDFAEVPKPKAIEEVPPRTGWKRWVFGPGGKDRWEKLQEAIDNDFAEMKYLRYRDKIMCKRFPESVEKFKTDTCGEYKNFRDMS